MTGLRWMLVELRFLTRENQSRPPGIIGSREFLQECKKLRPLQAVAKAGELSFEIAFTRHYVGQGFIYPHRFIRILLPLQTDSGTGCAHLDSLPCRDRETSPRAS